MGGVGSDDVVAGAAAAGGFADGAGVGGGDGPDQGNPRNADERLDLFCCSAWS